MSSSVSTFLISLLALTSISLVSAHRRKAVGCEGSRLELYCEGDKVISVLRANYGRISSSVCGDNRGQDWSTRCIQPRTLREVTSRCSSDSSSPCSLEVSSSVFGDPCPNTPKYLEVVYTCQSQSVTRKTPRLPDWILQIKSLPAVATLVPRPSSTTTEPTARPQFEVNTDHAELSTAFKSDNLHFPESLPLLNEEELEVEVMVEEEKGQVEDVEAEIVFINQPKTEAERGNILEDERILPAVIIISVSVFILGVVGLYLLLHRRDDSGPSEVLTVVKLDTNHYPQHHYPHYNFLPDRERNIYQVKSVSSEESSHNYYQII